jgi:YVTN family beta-propeller protein
LIIALLLAAAMLCSQPAPREQVGPLPTGGFLLNSGWRLEPAGKQIPLDTFPMSTALSPDGRYLLVLNGGYKPPTISVLEAATGRETSACAVADGWLGLTFSPKGDRVYVGGGSRAAVFEFSFADGALEPTRTFTVVPPDKRTHVRLHRRRGAHPDGHLIYAADLYHDSVVVINPQSGMLIDRVKTGRRPYRILFPSRWQILLRHKLDGRLRRPLRHRLRQPAHHVRLGPHPTDMVWAAGKSEASEGETPYAARLFIAASNTNSVYTLGVSEGKELRLIETINTAMTPRQPAGMTPSAWPSAARQAPLRGLLRRQCGGGGGYLRGAQPRRRVHSHGLVSHGGARAAEWHAGGAERPRGRLASESARAQSRAPSGGQPQGDAGIVEYVGRIQTGTASFIDPFTDEQLQAYTKTAMANSAYRDEKLDAQSVPAHRACHLHRQGEPLLRSGARAI